MKKDSQFYSKIAKEYLEELSKENGIKFSMICWGNLDDMEELFDRFGGNRDETLKKAASFNDYINKKFSFVMNKLDYESKKPDAIFKKGFIHYNGILKHPTRCFTLITKWPGME